MVRRLLPLLAATALAAAPAAQDLCWTPPPGVLPAGGTAPPGAVPTIAFEDSVHALVVFVRFSDDDAEAHEWPLTGAAGADLPPWGAGLVHERPEAVGPGLDPDDRSLSAFFYRHSVGGPGGPHVLTGEVWPRDARGAPRAFVPAAPSTAYRGGRETGYGFLVREVLDGLVRAPGFDLGRFDANRDGELDHLMLVVRRDPGVRVTGGVASLAGVTMGWGSTYGRPAATLTYPSERGPIAVDLGPYGSGAINWVGGEYAFRTLAHEYGHVLFDMGHTAMIPPPDAPVRSPATNDVPLDVPEGKGAFACQYARMCGGGASNGRPYESSNYDQTAGLSGHELRRMGWARRTVLDPARDTAGVRLRPLVGSGDVVLIPLGAGAAGDTLSLEHRRRADPWSAFPAWDLPDPYFGAVARDLPAEGLLVTLSHGDPAGPARSARYDVLPPSNRFRSVSRCTGTSDGCFAPYGPWDGDMLHPDRSATQLTPWTRPNVSGYTVYPEGAEPRWFGVLDVHHDGDALAFDVVADVRTQAEVVIAADSWMGAETSGWTFTQPVRVTNGATLTVWQSAEVTFAGGLHVEDGAAVVCHPGTSCGRRAIACPVPPR